MKQILLAVALTTCARAPCPTTARTVPAPPPDTLAPTTPDTVASTPTGTTAYGEPFILRPSPPTYYDLFGRTVAAHGEHIAVTSGRNLGFVHVYRRMQRNTWTEAFALRAPSGSSGFGRVLALAPETLVVTCDDQVAWVYGLSTNSQPARLVMGSSIDGVTATDDMVILSARRAPPRVWRRQQNQWRQTQDLDTAQVTSDIFGGGIARDGDTLAVGALHFTARAHRQGAVVIYRLRGDQWQLEQVLAADDGGENHFLGSIVAVANDVVAATAGSHERGLLYVYRRTNRWQQVARLEAPLGSTFTSVAMPDADTILYDGSAGTSVYRRVQTDDWQLTQQLDRTEAGWRISSSGDLLVVPSPNSTVDGVKLAGSAYVFERGAHR